MRVPHISILRRWVEQQHDFSRRKSQSTTTHRYLSSMRAVDMTGSDKRSKVLMSRNGKKQIVAIRIFVMLDI
jgi:hypothetical protein